MPSVKRALRRGQDPLDELWANTVPPKLERQAHTDTESPPRQLPRSSSPGAGTSARELQLQLVDSRRPDVDKLKH